MKKKKASAKKSSKKAAPVAKKASKSSKQATKTKGADTGQPRGPRAKRSSGLDAAAKVLAEAKEPMGCKDIVQQMLDKGLWQTKGKTPAATIYASVLREIQKKGKASRFVKVGRGQFAINQ